MLVLQRGRCRIEETTPACDWFGRARSLAPTSARLVQEHAYALSQVGDVSGSLRAYADASTLSGDGQADFDAARLLLTSEGGAREALMLFQRALERSPWLAIEAPEEPEIWDALGDDGVSAMRDAIRRADALRQ